MLYLRLFIEFFRAGLFAVGGGLATLPFLYEISDKTGWFTHGQLADMVAVSESTPGPIGVNMATYVGFTSAGVLGAVIATLGLITPSVIVIILVSRILKKFEESKVVQGAFYGLRPASVALIAAACFLVVKISLLDMAAFADGNIIGMFRIPQIIMAGILWYGMKKLKFHPVVFLLASAVVGIVFGKIGF